MPRRNRKTLLLLLACIPVLFTFHLFASQSAAENWPRFRGDNGTGVVSSGGKLPTEWSPGDFSWNIELPGLGHASPVIWGDKLFVTSAIDEGAIRYLFCLNSVTGEQIWSRVIGLARSHKHNKNSWASSTPAVDGEHVYVAFADEETHTLTAYDFSGDIVWRRDIGTFESQHGQGVSPIVYNDLVILPNDQMGPSSVVGFDRKTGHTVWSTIRTHRRTSYATPFILRQEGRPDELICLSGAMGVSSLDPNTGHLNWLTGELPLRTVASPILADGLIIASCGGGGIGKLLIAVEPGGWGEI